MTYENLKEYLEKEKKNLLKLLDEAPDWATPEQLIKETISQNYGVVMFLIEYSDIEYEKASALWDEYHDFYKKLESELKENTKNWKRRK